MSFSSGMQELQEVVRAFGANFETMQTSDRTKRKVLKKLGVPDWFASFYEQNGPAAETEMEWVVEALELWSFGELPAAQRGYRWVGLTRITQDPAWNPSWVVVASISGDPIFVDTATEPGPVFFAYHGEGSWEPQLTAPSMEVFVQSLARFFDVLYGVFDLEVTDDAFELLPEFLEQAEKRLVEVLSVEQARTFLKMCV